MSLFTELAGFTPQEADEVRRAMGYIWPLINSNDDKQTP